MHILVPIFASALIVASCAPATVSNPAKTGFGCGAIMHKGDSYTVCRYSSTDHDIRLFHSDSAGQPYLQFDALARNLDQESKTLVFAMNGGMYHNDRRPVGFYRDRYGDRSAIITADGPGNFHLKPNGVFWLDENGAGITESRAYIEAGLEPVFATQSGPMLVIDGNIHPAINPDGSSRKRRNGVGVNIDGRVVFFAISDGFVTFHEFATLFRDTLNMPNALFLDGQVSRIYAPAIARNEPGPDMGPIIGVME